MPRYRNTSDEWQSHGGVLFPPYSLNSEDVVTDGFHEDDNLTLVSYYPLVKNYEVLVDGAVPADPIPDVAKYSKLIIENNTGDVLNYRSDPDDDWIPIQDGGNVEITLNKKWDEIGFKESGATDMLLLATY